MSASCGALSGVNCAKDWSVWRMGAAAACIPGQKVYPMPYAPTPENIARHLLEDVCPKILVDLDVRATHVAVEENESIAAVASVFG